MGIQGLIPLLKPAHTWKDISDYSGKTLAVDAYVWLHKGAFSCAEELVRGKQSPKLVNYCMHRVRLLKYHGVKPYIVFDGGDLPAKLGTEDDRAQRRSENLLKANALHDQGRIKEARELYTKCIDVTPELALQFIKALKAENVDFVVAPYEADAQLAYLERNGIVDGIITEDSDLLVFGCKNVLFKMDGDGKCCEIRRETIGFGDGLGGGMGGEIRFDGWGDSEFRHMAILSGCDYIPSIHGVGIKTAHKLLRKLKTVEKVLQHLRLEGKEIPADYRDQFRLAELTFLHQRVYDSETQRLVPLSPLPEGLGEEEGMHIGPDLEPAIARGIALGERNPITKKLFVDPWPDFRPVPLKTQIKHQPKISDMFKKVPKPSPHPVLKHSVSAPTPSSSRMAFGKGSGSGRQRLSDLSHLSAVARGKLPAAADDSDAEEDVQGPSTTTTVIKTSKFFSSTTASAKPRPTSHQPRPLRRDDSLSLETFPTVDQPFQSVEGLSPRPMEDGQELPTVDELFDQLRSSTPEDIEMDFPPGFENITPPLDKPSSSAASFISLSPCAPASPQQQLFDQDFSEVFSSPSSMRFGGRRGGRESSMDGYISSSPAPGETPRKRLGTREREESLGRVEEVEDGMEVEVEVVGREEVDLREVCVGTTTTKKGGKGGGGKKVARKEDESSVVASSDVVEEEDEEEERREEKLSVIAKGWRERFTLKKGPSTSPFNKASPLTSRTSLPTPTRPLLSNNGASTSNSTFARTTSTPTNFLSSKNTPSSLASRNQKKDERTPVASLFAKVNPQTNTPRSLPPRFSFAPRLAGKENAGSGTPTAAASASAKEKRKAAEVEVDANAEEEGRRGNGKKKRVVVLDEDDEDEEEEIVPSSSLKEVASPTSSARKRLDVFRFRPKVC